MCYQQTVFMTKCVQGSALLLLTKSEHTSIYKIMIRSTRVHLCCMAEGLPDVGLIGAPAQLLRLLD